jgi:transposase-like protein
MDTEITEQALRQEAIRRRLEGERRCDICRDLQRSLRWFHKWWAEYQCNPQTDFTDRSRAPRSSPHQTPASVEQAVIEIRQALEAAETSETKYGLIGKGVIRAQLERLHIRPLPSPATIQRLLAGHGLTHPVGAGSDAAYYPWPVAWEVNAIQSTDIITRHIRGGEEIENFHTLDLYSHAVYLTQHLDKSSLTMGAHLRKTWANLGLPLMMQLDNEAAFCGGYTHPRVIGQVVRLCLFCGVEPFFIPVYDAKRNYQIETFHSVWDKSFWSREEFVNLAHLHQETPLFLRWYHHRYCPPSLDGFTPAQMRRGATIQRLTANLCHLIPDGRLPLTAGRIHLMRKVDGTGHIELLNESWPVGEKWVGEYVRATVNTTKQALTIWHKADDWTDWHLIKTRKFQLKEIVCDLLPVFRRNRARCRELWPG